MSHKHLLSLGGTSVTSDIGGGGGHSERDPKKVMKVKFLNDSFACGWL